MMSSQKAYTQIVKATSIMAISSLVVQVLSMVRVKFAAQIIGVAGIGLATTYNSIPNVFGIIFSLGLHTSAVRDIAVAISTGDQKLFGRTVIALRRLCLLTGIIGMLIFIFISPLISEATFGNQQHSMDVAMLGMIILFANVSGGQMAILQGASKISEMAKVNILSGFSGALCAVTFYLLFGMQGIVPALISISAALLFFSWLFSRKIKIPYVKQTFFQTLAQAKNMAKLGFVMMLNGLLVSLVSYITIALIRHYEGLDGVGIYSAAFALSGVFVNFVLGSMAADYYPRLTGVIANKVVAIKMINQQTEVSTLIALPGLLITFILAPWFVGLMYTDEFLSSVNLIHWFVLGCMGRVLSWPLGFLMLALGKGRLFLLTEIFFNILHIIIIFAGLNLFGIEGVAIAYFLVNFIYIPCVYLIAKNLIFFKWSDGCTRLFTLSFMIFFLIFLIFHFLPQHFAIMFGVLIWVAVCRESLRGLISRIGSENKLVSFILKFPIMRKVL